MVQSVDSRTCAKIICNSGALALGFCILICLKQFRMPLNNAYIKIIRTVYRGLVVKKIHENQRYCSVAFENYSLASECC